MSTLKPKTCGHLEHFEVKDAKAYECEECTKTGNTWVHLRTCQSCGMTLCCESSPNQHMRKHYETHGHPVVKSAEPGDNWAYCYDDNLFKKLKL